MFPPDLRRARGGSRPAASRGHRRALTRWRAAGRGVVPGRTVAHRRAARWTPRDVRAPPARARSRRAGRRRTTRRRRRQSLGGRRRSGRDAPPLSVLSFELEAQAGSRAIGPQGATDRRERTVEQHVLDTLVIVEVLEMTHAAERAA